MHRGDKTVLSHYDGIGRRGYKGESCTKIHNSAADVLLQNLVKKEERSQRRKVSSQRGPTAPSFISSVQRMNMERDGLQGKHECGGGGGCL
jgi:hypothetical protein